MRDSKNFRGTYSEKISVFITMTRLQVLSEVYGKQNRRVAEKFLNY